MKKEQQGVITNNDYAEIIIEYDVSPELLVAFPNDPIHYIDDKYAIIYFTTDRIPTSIVSPAGYAAIPKLYSLLETSHLESMGINKVQSIRALSLRGQGILLGFMDTGIDYTSPLFQNEDGSTRILSLWDQTIPNSEATADTYFYGKEFTREQINEALQSPDPLSIVPSSDDIGHGTTLAGLAGGTYLEKENFSGVAPLSEFVIVKLKPAKPYLKEYFGVPSDTHCYSEVDLLFALTYLAKIAKRENRPIAICIGLGTNQGGHEGLGTFNDMITFISNQGGNAIVIAAGNEGNFSNHYYGEISNAINFDTVELRVAEKEHDFSLELWGNVPGTYSIDILSPTGEYISRIPARIGTSKKISFLFEPTIIYIDYLIVESSTGDQLIHLRFKNPTSGIWKFRVYGSTITSGFHMWLPLQNFITPGTGFIKPSPETTITVPGNNYMALTATAYNHRNNALYINASKGYSRYNNVKPDFALPGVEVYSPLPGMKFTQATGSSIAAAQLTGLSALLLEWGILKGNDRRMSTIQIRKYLIRGVKRSPDVTYPNKEWGYGIANLYGIFESLLS